MKLSAMDVQPITLEGTCVRLKPLLPQHVPQLWNVAKDSLEDIFRWIPYPMQSYEDFERAVALQLDEQSRGLSVPFVTIEHCSGQVIGSTRFMNIGRNNRRVEIGSTWIAPAWQRTAINTEAKYLMMCVAFERWKCIR